MPFTRNAIVILECALSPFLGEVATAQTPATGPTLQIGARVRVRSSTPGPFGSATVATLLAHQGDTLSLRPEGTQDSLALPFGSITRLEVSAGRSSHVGQGMGLGFLSGVSIGAIVGAISYTPSGCSFLCGRGFDAVAGGLAGGLLGTLIGGFMGARQTDNWERVGVPAGKVGFRLAPFAKSGLMMSATF